MLHKIGLITGLGPKASFNYGQKINQSVNRRLGGWTSAPMVINSIDHNDLKSAMDADDRAAIQELVGRAADEVYLANAKALVICSNTLHCTATMVGVRHHAMPIIHIGDVIALAVKESRLQRLGLLGTKITTLNQWTILDRLCCSGATIYRPENDDMDALDYVIYHNLYKGKNMTDSRVVIAAAIRHLVERAQIQGVIFGSTELEWCFTRAHQDDLCRQLKLPDLRFFRSMSLHINAAAEFVCTGKITQLPYLSGDPKS